MSSPDDLSAVDGEVDRLAEGHVVPKQRTRSIEHERARVSTARPEELLLVHAVALSEAVTDLPRNLDSEDVRVTRVDGMNVVLEVSADRCDDPLDPVRPTPVVVRVPFEHDRVRGVAEGRTRARAPRRKKTGSGRPGPPAGESEH